MTRRSSHARALLLALLGACAKPPAPTAPPAQDRDRVAIVVAEAASTGIKLVAIDEHGDRQFDLIAPPEGGAIVKDLNPAVSPDGSRVAFARARGATADRYQIWIAPLGVEVAPRQLTDGPVDSQPVWTRDGKSIVFASTRDGGDFDLWQVAIDGGAPVQLTHGEGHEVTPTIAPDGTIIYAAVDPQTSASRLEQRAPDGTITALTPGPDEREPAVSPDGATIAFTSRVERNGRKDGELWSMRRGGAEAQQLVDLPPTDESGPVWSRDGRYVFATSVLPGAEDRPLFASVVFVDLTTTPRRVRVLRDSAGALARVTPAIATPALDAAALARDPEYLPELAKVMAAAIANQQMQR